MRKVQFIKNEYYHIFNRGVDKRTTFTSPKEYERFLYNLYLSNSKDSFKIDNITKYKNNAEKIFGTPRSKTLVSIHAYSLMPNHFHLLVSEKVDGGISMFMQKVSTAYTMYFNKKHNRSGSLFQGTFKSVHINSDIQLRYLFSYIHANAFSIIRKNGSIHLEDIGEVLHYPYSSMSEYMNISRPVSSVVDVLPFIKEELINTSEIKEHLNIWLDYHKHSEV